MIDRMKLKPPTPAELSEWYCIVTNPGCQRRVELALYAMGLRTFLPKLKRWISHARVKRAVERPLLARYLFVEATDRDFERIRQTPGVESIVSINGSPAPLPRAAIEALLVRYLRGEWDFVSANKNVPYLDASGEWKSRTNPPVPQRAIVQIIEGEFEMLLATVIGRSGGMLNMKLRGTRQYIRLNETSVRAA